MKQATSEAKSALPDCHPTHPTPAQELGSSPLPVPAAPGPDTALCRLRGSHHTPGFLMIAFAVWRSPLTYSTWRHELRAFETCHFCRVFKGGQHLSVFTGYDQRKCAPIYL